MKYISIYNPGTPLYGYRDFSYASGNTATIGTYKVPLVHNLKRPPPTKQRVLPSKEQRVLEASDQAQQMQPTKYKRMTIGFNTMTPAAYMRFKTYDNNNKSHQPTARRLTWEDERVNAPCLNLKIDEDQSFQTNAEKLTKSEANEINSLIRSGASSPIQCRANAIKAPAISTYVPMRFATITTKPISSKSNFRRHYTNKLVATWMQMRASATKAHMKSKQLRDLS
jgi:hypothetical protein